MNEKTPTKDSPKDKKGITKWLDPNQASQTHHGFITNHEWLLKEKDRIESETGKMCIIFKNDKKQEYLSYT